MQLFVLQLNQHGGVVAVICVRGGVVAPGKVHVLDRCKGFVQSFEVDALLDTALLLHDLPNIVVVTDAGCHRNVGLTSNLSQPMLKWR